jgi:hypothetical protein
MLLLSSSKHLKKLTLLSKKKIPPADKRKNPAEAGFFTVR